MKHWHREDEIEKAVALYLTGMTAASVARAIDPGSSKGWVLNAVRKRDLIRSTYETRRMRDPGFDGRIIRDGYVLIWQPRHPKADSWGRVREHVLVWEQAHPKELIKPSEVIHHKNGNKADNRLENLEKMTRTEHRFHMPRGLGRKGRRAIAEIGEKLAIKLGIQLNPIDIGCDGIFVGRKAEVKTRRPSSNFRGWRFLTDKADAEIYIFIGLNKANVPVAVWLIPTKALGNRQSISLISNEHRQHSFDPWTSYRVAPFGETIFVGDK